MVEADGVFAVGLTRVHDDGDFHVGAVGVEAAVLDFALFFPAPGALSGDAESGVIEHPEHASAGFELLGAGVADLLQVGHVLDAEDGGDGVELTETGEVGGVA